MTSTAEREVTGAAFLAISAIMRADLRGTLRYIHRDFHFALLEEGSLTELLGAETTS
jgi:hypothetical protein